MNLLIIDDDNIDRMNSIRALGRSGHSFNVTEASSAEEGLNLYKSENFDIILLDYQLPTMTGLELMGLFSETTESSTAVVMLSNSDDEALTIKCIEAGAQDFIVKSEVTTSRLIRSILHAKERYRIELKLINSHKKLRELAEKDTLTGLANRYVFEDNLEQAISRTKRTGKCLGLLMLDLDNFKIVNDTLGHSAGDQLLFEVSKRLSVPIRDGDLLCRIGGDEFAILVHNLDDPIQLHHLTDRISKALSEPFFIEGVELVVTMSIGVANYPNCAQDSMHLLKCADIAMYRSKEKGRNQTHFYSKEIHDTIQRRMELERELRLAIEREEFVTYYQPQIDCFSGEFIAAEALIRWQHPTKGLVGPNEFIPIAEEIGVIDQIGEWVLRTACAQFARWNVQFKDIGFNMPVAVNLSALQLGHSAFVETVKDILNTYDFDPQQLEFEITESTLINSSEASGQNLEVLSKLGIKLALDDFGTGYSSLSQLQKYPFQVLKVDKSFVQSASDNSKNANFLIAINAFAKILGIVTVVEGVETLEQKELCQELQFDRMQGYYFAKPMGAEKFEEFIKRIKATS